MTTAVITPDYLTVRLPQHLLIWKKPHDATLLEVSPVPCFITKPHLVSFIQVGAEFLGCIRRSVTLV